MPFIHSCVHTNGDIKLCCLSKEKSQYNIKYSTVDEWWNSEYLKEVRQQLLDGKELTECKFCYALEEQGVTSQRQQRNLEYKVIQTKNADKIINYLGYDKLEAPIDVEIQLTNLCNLKCIMCNETESSAILTENKKLQIATHNQTEFDWNTETVDKIKKIFVADKNKLISIRGGEPFMVPQIKDILKYSIETGSSKNIKLHISTNCTKFDQHWVNLLNQFKEVRMMCSLDAVGNLSEYIRYNSDWALVKQNIQLMRSIKNINIVINATVQNTNLLGLHRLIDWCQQENLFLSLNFLQSPRFMQIDVLPDELLKQALDLLLTTKENLINSNIVTNLDNLINLLTQIKSAYKSNHWNDFVTNIKMRESVRNNLITDVIPELEPYLNAKAE